MCAILKRDLKLKRFLAIYMGLIFFACLCCRHSVAAMDEKPLAKIAFDAVEKNYGVIDEGDDQPVEFIIRNTGESELVISHLRSLCDCVEVMMDDTIIQPGKSSGLRGVFRSDGRWGEQEKIIVISSNAWNVPEAELKISLSVESGVRVTPRSFSFGEIPRGRSSSKKVKIEARLEGELKINHMQVLSAHNVTASLFRRKISPIELPSRKSGYLSEIDIILKAVNDGAGQFSGQLNIDTNLSRKPHLQILFSGEKIGDLEAVPAVIQFKNVLPGHSVSGATIIKSLDHGPFRVTGFDAGKLPVTMGKGNGMALEEQKVNLVFTAPEKPRRFYRGYVYLKTNHSTQKKI